MPVLDTIQTQTKISLPRCSADLVIRPLDEGGKFVVKNRRTGKYIKLGAQEAFLLELLDGTRFADDILAEFENRFDEPLDEEDLGGFIQMASAQGLLAAPGSAATPADATNSSPLPEVRVSWTTRLVDVWQWLRSQNILFFRVKLFDPESLLNRVEPVLRPVFTRQFVVLTLVIAFVALVITLTNRTALISAATASVSYEAFIVVAITVILATFAHEFAHGLACKHYGGEVREIGLLMMFFTPFLYCNVSDAWLFPERRKRLIVSLAGSYLDLCVWSVAVFVWRLTPPGTVANYFGLIVLSTCGMRVLFNMNPLMKLDGYYLLGDWLGIANLRQRGQETWARCARWLLWGGPRPERAEHSRLLLLYGFASWAFTITFLQVILFNLVRMLAPRIGIFGLVPSVLLGAILVKQLFGDFFTMEFSTMLKKRHLRTAAWVIGVAVLLLFPIRDRASGPFQLRPAVRVELRAPVSGFLRDVNFGEGDDVSPDSLIATIEIPELDNQSQRKAAEIRESRANLRRLEAGARPEEIAELREKVKRAAAWRDRANSDLERARRGYEEELFRLDQKINQARGEAEFAVALFQQADTLYHQGGLAGQQYLAEKKRRFAAEAEVHQAEATKRERMAQGLATFESELARRTKELADTEASLKLLEAGNRPEDIEAERARLARLMEEDKFLTEQREKQAVRSPVAGLITTERLKEKVGTYLEKGAVICVIEDLSRVEAEIAIGEHEAASLEVGQNVSLKARSNVSQSFEAKVARISPLAVSEERAPQSKMLVYCQLENPDRALRSGMTGFGRVYHDLRPLGMVMLSRAVSFLRTEFWW